MASASRVPLLVKSKGRLPSRISIAPRTKPLNGPRTKRSVPLTSDKTKDNEAENEKAQEAQKTTEESLITAKTITTSTTKTSTKSGTPAVKIAASKSTIVATSETMATLSSKSSEAAKASCK
ncbi:unnamed protein product [Peronospora destructor]|uniref:Uncharacterized protein n=1 Tax=Peronospora destructor TaxID=86335 RepID=A0AAV0UGU2_9STRA|nr:unnamed protein product [Peronospora destructor]